MSKAYKCDICGDLFETINYVKIDKNKDAYIELCGTRYDICPNCISAIQSTINGLSKSNRVNISCDTCKPDPFENYPCPLKEVCGKVHNNLEAKK